MDIEYIKQHYSSLSDDELRQIDREQLVPDAVPVLDSELRTRGLSVPISQLPERSDKSVDPGAVPSAAPEWSKKLVAYATYSPFLLLVLGVRGVLWIFIISYVGRVAALKYAIRVRSSGASTENVIFKFIVVHIVASLAFVLVANQISLLFLR